MTADPVTSPAAPAGLLARRWLLVALWATASAVGWGAVVGLRRGSAEVAAQGYGDLDFARGREVALVSATDHGALGGLHAVLPWTVGALVLLLVSRRARELVRPSRLVELLADPTARLQAQVAWALILGAGSYALAARQENVLTAELTWLGALIAGSCFALEVVGRRLASLARRDEPRLVANVAASCAVLAPLCLVLFEVDRRRVYRPTAVDTLIANTVVAGLAMVAFVVVRRAVLVGRVPTVVRAACVVLALFAATPFAVRPWAAAPERPGLASVRNHNVVVLGIDTLRADHTTLLEPKPGERDLTPNLRALARRGTVFTNAISQSPWTMPAFASIVTGKYPLQHGAVSLSGKLRAREVTLAEILRETGRATGGFVSHDYVDHKHGFAQGFDEYDDSWAQGHTAISSAAITDFALDFVARHADRPFFLFTHYFDPHYEYRDHAEWDFADGYDGWLKTQFDFENLVTNRHLLGPAELAYTRDLYDEEIAYTDRELGRLVADFERRGLLASTVFVLVADHGEEFMEHGNIGHTTTLFDELVHVPLAVVVPGGEAGLVVADTVETRRVFSTVLEAIGSDFGALERPKGLLAPSGETPAAGHVAYSMLWLPDAQPRWGKRFQLASLRSDHWKLVRDLTRGVDLLFDLSADPRELRDVSKTEAKRLEELSLALDAWVAEMQKSAGDVPMVEIDDALRERLHALGYM
ncbi:MAG: sulfatase [Planctomycetes bacterium]|nr:sulfatase [Planctomycetota bacterium]